MAASPPIQVVDSPLTTGVQQQPIDLEDADFPVHGGPFFEYRKLVGNISEKLRKENALRLAYIYELPAWYYEVGATYDSSHSLRIMMALEGKDVFSPKSMSGLAKALKSIQREDLEKLVNEFIDNSGMNTGHHGRLNTHPQRTMRQTWSNYSLRNRPRPLIFQHSTSLSSLAAEMLFAVADVEQDGMYRAQSKPELNAERRTTPSGEQTPPAPSGALRGEGELGIGLQFALMNSRTLLKQLLQLRASSSAQPRESAGSPLIPPQTSLEEAVLSAQQLTLQLKTAWAAAGGTACSQSEPPTSRSTPVREWEGTLFPTRKFSRCSSGGHVKSTSGLSSHSSGVFMSPVRFQESDTKRQLDFVDRDVETDGTKVKPVETEPQARPTSDLMPPLPEEMHRSIPMTSRKISRRRSKKLCRKGLLVWQLKVKRLKDYCKQRDSKLESEDFFDSLKRRFKASLYPHGIGQDTGAYMTLCINCLDEPKSQSFSNTEIVVSILDPQSSTHTIQPITRTLERRGIRVVQQFISHKQVAEFHSGIVLLSIAAVGKTEESEGESGDSQ